MPPLKKVYLEYVFIGPELVDFLVGHIGLIEEVALRDCYSGVGDYRLASTEHGIHWHQFFDALTITQPQKLHTFKISSDRSPTLNSKEELDEPDGDESVDDEVRQAKDMLERDRKRRVFADGHLDDKYGSLSEDRRENLQSFWEGRDQASFEKLIEIVERNAGGDGGTGEIGEGEKGKSGRNSVLGPRGHKLL